MKKLFFTLMKGILMLLAVLVPKKEGIIVYGAWKGQRFSDNPKFLFLEAVKHSDFRNIWISRSKDLTDKIRSMGAEAYYVHSIKGLWYQLIAGKAVICVGLDDLFKPFMCRKIIIQLWHGIPLKKIGYDVYSPDGRERIQNLFFKKKMYVLYTSLNYFQIYKKAFGLNSDQYILSGQPRNDVFFDSSLCDPTTLRRIIEISGERKTVLYLPTHRSEGKVDMCLSRHLDFARLNRLLEDYKACMILSRHFYHRNETLITGYENIADVSRESLDTQTLLAQCDLLITDYSSCYIDYLLCKKPIIFFQYDIGIYQRDEREMYFNDSFVTPGPKAMEFEELVLILISFFEGNLSGYSEMLSEALDFFYDRDHQGVSSLELYEKIKAIA